MACTVAPPSPIWMTSRWSGARSRRRGPSGVGTDTIADSGGNLGDSSLNSSSWRMPSMSKPSVESCSSSITRRSSGGSNSNRPWFHVSMRNMALRGVTSKLSSMLAK